MGRRLLISDIKTVPAPPTLPLLLTKLLFNFSLEPGETPPPPPPTPAWRLLPLLVLFEKEEEEEEWIEETR